MSFEYVARCDGEVTFSGSEERVCARSEGGGAIELPEELRSAMAPYVED